MLFCEQSHLVQKKLKGITTDYMRLLGYVVKNHSSYLILVALETDQKQKVIVLDQKTYLKYECNLGFQINSVN